MDSPKKPTTARWFPASAAGDILLTASLIVLIVGVPTVFLRTAFLTFDLPQLTLLWVMALAVLLYHAYGVVVSGVLERGPRLLSVSSSAFIAVLVLTTVLSSQPWVSFTGLTVRGAGALTYGLCLVLLHAVYRLGRRRSVEPLVLAFVFAHCIVVFYALLQAYGLDPFTWGKGDIYVGPVFSTLGNPNFSAGYIGLTLPLLVWVSLGSTYRRPLRVAAGAATGASAVALIHLNSFQGDVAALTTVAVLGQWVISRDGRDRLVAAVISLPTVGAIVSIPMVASGPPAGALLGAMACLSVSTTLGIWWDQRRPHQVGASSGRITSRGRRVIWLAGTAGVITGLLLFGSRILDELEEGLEHRIEFWKASLSIFRSSPIVGTGLETYPAYFTAHRSLDHAIAYENVLSDSPHSVPLGFLNGGGLLLALTYATLLGVVGYYGVRAVRNSERPKSLFYGAVLTAWSAYHLQSAVSMDMPGLIHTQWLLAGVLLAGGVPSSLPEFVLPFAKLRSTGWFHWVAASLLIVALLVCLRPVVAPFRADLATYRANQAFAAGDLQTAGEEVLQAIHLQPRNGSYASNMALVYAESGLPELSLREYERASALLPGNHLVATATARAAMTLNRPEVAQRWYERALSNEPHGARVIAESANFFAQFGDPSRAIMLLDSFESLRSLDAQAWLMARDGYAALGDQDMADHADQCAGGGHIVRPAVCWPES